MLAETISMDQPDLLISPRADPGQLSVKSTILRVLEVADGTAQMH